MSAIPVITVDGPSGSGKGVISQWLAQKLGWHLLDSGALYRLLALAAEKHSLSLSDIVRLVELAQKLDIQFDTQSAEGVITFLAGEDVSLALRTEECARNASQVAAIPEVRTALLERQRAFRQVPGLVADGRDMGTVVFPDAELKIFLTASAAERARRRHKQLNQKGISANLAALSEEIRARDERDQNRAVSPLKPAANAIILDTTHMGIDAVCQAAYTKVQELKLLTA
ncbi:MAG: (d)CMP kinase [Gammaproteobacteria bacterium]|nr:(d)CMP kinase [Gammaproteobacteria bacterium]